MSHKSTWPNFSSVSPISEQRKRKLPEGSEAIDYLDEEIIKVLNLILPSFEDDILDLEEDRQESFRKYLNSLKEISSKLGILRDKVSTMNKSPKIMKIMNGNQVLRKQGQQIVRKMVVNSNGQVPQVRDTWRYIQENSDVINHIKSKLFAWLPRWQRKKCYYLLLQTWQMVTE